ncbi:MAG: hypothetical protein LQ347_006001, partial [Umbilicaria vellea]
PPPRGSPPPFSYSALRHSDSTIGTVAHLDFRPSRESDHPHGRAADASARPSGRAAFGNGTLPATWSGIDTATAIWSRTGLRFVVDARGRERRLWQRTPASVRGAEAGDMVVESVVDRMLDLDVGSSGRGSVDEGSVRVLACSKWGGVGLGTLFGWYLRYADEEEKEAVCFPKAGTGEQAG